MREIFDVVRQVAPSQTTVLITGESGTGKELIARAIHQLSPRAHAPLIIVHCAALASTLLESELFGHEKGAFTGAHERRLGRIEQAQGGTLFLDEIGEIDATIQIKLLRFLGERTFERVGSSKTLVADVRLIAATNKNLEQMVQEGKFREDLFYRLNVVPIQMPPLRDRREDIPALANAFLKEFAEKNKKTIVEIEPAAMDLLMAYPWKGNVRELRAAIEGAVVLGRRDRIGLRELPASIRNFNPALAESGGAPPRSNMTVVQAEKQLIFEALKNANGNRTDAAKRLGISRRTLHRKLHAYHLEGF
jgi:DNA-binding NtrC family response regulator